jgi:hypothetical protein
MKTSAAHPAPIVPAGSRSGTGAGDAGPATSVLVAPGPARRGAGRRTDDGIRSALVALERRGRGFLQHDETGAATAEYAIATLAAVGFAGLLVVILRSEQVRALLAGIIETALTVAG